MKKKQNRNRRGSENWTVIVMRGTKKVMEMDFRNLEWEQKQEIARIRSMDGTAALEPVPYSQTLELRASW